MLVLPVDSSYDQRFTVQLGDDRYVVEARWNERGKIWTLDLTRDIDQQLLIAGVPVLAGQDILAPYALGRGGLIVTDLGLRNSDPGPDDFGDRVIVTWLSNDELAALDAALKAANLPSTIATGAPPPLIVSTPGAGAGGGAGSGVGGGTTIINSNTVTNTFTSNGGQAFSNDVEYHNDTGGEILVKRFIINIGLNPNPTVGLAIAALAGGNGTLKAYVGGTFEPLGTTGVLSGTAIGSVAVVGDGPYEINGALANPGGMVPIKVTMKSAAPLTEVAIYDVSGTIG